MVPIYLVALLATAAVAAPKPDKDDHLVFSSKGYGASSYPKRIVIPRRDEYEPLDDEEPPQPYPHHQPPHDEYQEEDVRYIPFRKEPRRGKSARRLVYMAPPDRYERPEWRPKPPRPEPAPVPDYLADFTADQPSHKDPPSRPEHEPEYLGDMIYDHPSEREQPPPPPPPKKIYRSGKPTYKKLEPPRHQDHYYEEERSREVEPCRPKRPNYSPPATSCPEEETEYAECDCCS